MTSTYDSKGGPSTEPSRMKMRESLIDHITTTIHTKAECDSSNEIQDNTMSLILVDALIEWLRTNRRNLRKAHKWYHMDVTTEELADLLQDAS